jgi:superfamily II DNA or RNA helicase
MNGQALCAACNLQKGSRMTPLRPWQEKALNQALHWLLQERTDRHFLINAAPGSGKTRAACAIADAMIKRGEVERVIVIAPRKEVVGQWARDFQQATGRRMLKVTGIDGAVGELEHDLCATWSSVQGLSDALQAVCQNYRVLVICDEHHHAAVQAAWGSGADSAFHRATFVLVLTGTPIRSDGKKSVWLAYDDRGAIEHPEEGTFTLNYGKAVDLGYCRPVAFHRHEGLFSVDFGGGEAVKVSGKRSAELPADLKRIPALQRVLDFYRLARTCKCEEDGLTPLAQRYQGTMLTYASQKLDELRYRMPNAGGLIITPSIEIANYMVRLIELIEGETPTLVHSRVPHAANKIEAFRKTSKRWLVSVAMISEGVDIPRLRVLIYLPSALTELAFRQAVGRIVRTNGPADDTRACVVMPSFDILEAYARSVEEEMPPSLRKEEQKPHSKRCSICNAESPIGATKCATCGFEFPAGAPKFKKCHACEALNPLTAVACQSCDAAFATEFNLTLDEALRVGAIVRGMDVDEEEVLEAEKIAPAIRDALLKSGEEKFVKFVRTFPEELYARFRSILNSPSTPQ